MYVDGDGGIVPKSCAPEHRVFDEFPPWNPEMHEGGDAGRSAIPSPYAPEHVVADDDDDDGDDGPLHEQLFKEYQSFGVHFDRLYPTQTEASEWRLPELPTSHFGQPAQQFPSDVTCGQLRSNSIFSSKDEMEEVVGSYHLDNNVDYRVERADKGRWYLKCKHSNCKFILHATCKHDVWRVVKLVIPHTCILDPDTAAPCSMKSKFLGTLFAKKFSGKALSLTPRRIQEDMQSYGLSIKYNLARLAKEHAIAMLYGKGNESFSKLPAYLYQLQKANPGSYTNLNMDDDKVFKYAFFALGASITGFKNYGRPVIVIDGTHLKGKYCGIAFVAVTQDGNGQVFPLAIGIGDVESNESWTWFLRCIQEAYGCPNQLLFISDQHPSIIHAVRIVYPMASHGLCYHHLQQKLVSYGQSVVQLFYQAAYTYRLSDYHSFMQSLQRMDQSGMLMNKLKTMNPTRWARVHCPVPRYEFMTSNAAESWNKKLLWARKLPVVSMLECARLILEDWFTKRRDAAKAHNQVLCEEVAKQMAEVKKRASKLVVTSLGDNRYKVLVVAEFFIVSLVSRTCDCEEFERSLMPCIHAAAAIRFANCNISQFVHHCYWSESVTGIWGSPIQPVPHPNYWVNPEWVNDMSCFPPMQPRQAGRPRQSRRPTGLESSSSTRKSHVCSSCQQRGHNRTRCPTPQEVNQPQAPMRRARKCSKCGATGHTRPTCPNITC